MHKRLRGFPVRAALEPGALRREGRQFRTWALAGLALAGALAGCDRSPVKPADPAVLRIGATVSLSGPLAVEGAEVRRGYELWAEWVNEPGNGIPIAGRRYGVELIIHDDESDPARSAQLVESLITQHQVDFLLGPYGSDMTLAAAEVSEARGKLMVAGNGAAEEVFARGFTNFFMVLTPARDYARSALERLAALGANTVFIAHESAGTFSQSIAAGAVHWATEVGIEVVGSSTYARGTADLAPVLEAAAAAAPDVFLAGGYYQDAVSFARTAARLGIRFPALLLTVGPSIPQFVVELADTAEHVLGPTQWEPSMAWQDDRFGTAADYAARFEARFGVAPSYQAAESTAAALVLQLGLERANSLETAAVRAALRQLDVMTFYGPIRFDATGRNLAKPMGVTQVQDGRIVVVAPPEAAVAPLVYPSPASVATAGGR